MLDRAAEGGRTAEERGGAEEVRRGVPGHELEQRLMIRVL